MVTPGGEWHDDTIAPLERDTLFVRQANQFLDAIENSSPPACSIDDGAWVGAGDETQLARILETFLDWSNSRAPRAG